MTTTKIEWAATANPDGTLRPGRSDWNPVRGCTRKSPGCGGPGPHGGCYAEGIAARFSAPGMAFHGFAEMVDHKPRWTGKVAVMWDRLTDPLKWREPATIFALSMSDLFHEALPMDEIATIYAVMVAAVHVRGHTFQVLTKRSDRMREITNSPAFWRQVNAEAGGHVMERTDALARRSDDARATLDEYGPDNPSPGIWLGVSVESQKYADERVPDLLATPAAIRFLSCEPLLAGICFNQAWLRRPGGIDLAIIGGESGPKSRPVWVPAIRDMVANLRRADVACFVKQLGANVQDRNDAGFDGCEPDGWPDMDPFDIEHDLGGISTEYQGAPVRVHLKSKKGNDMAEWPEDLRVREMPVSHKEMPR